MIPFNYCVLLHRILAKKKTMEAAHSKISIQQDPAAFIAIHQLLQSYTDVINRRDWEALPELFWDDAVWKALKPVDMQLDGLAAIREGIPASVNRTSFLVQFATGIVIELENELKAKVRSHLSEVGAFLQTGKGLQAVGVYRDVVISRDGVWKFSKREFELRYTGDDIPTLLHLP